MVAVLDWTIDNGADNTVIYFNSEANTEWYESDTGSASVSGMWSIVCLTPSTFYAYPAAVYPVSVHVQAKIGGVWTTVGKYKIGFEEEDHVALRNTTSFVTPSSVEITALRVRGEMLPEHAFDDEGLVFIKNHLMFRLICSDQRVTQDVVYI